MATLEKIRSKSVLLLIVIGVALLAFIIGDFFKLSSIFGRDTTAVEVKDADIKIDIQDFSRAQNQAAQGVSSSSDNDRAALDQSVLHKMVFDQLRDKEYARLGLTVSDAELNDAVNGNASTFADYLVASQTNGQINSVAMFYDQTNNATKYGIPAEQAEQFKQAWLSFEDLLSQQLLEHKFSSMLRGTLVPNKLDGKQLYDEFNTAYNVSMASVPYTTLSNADQRFAVTDEDLKNEWNAHKQLFAINVPERRVSVINVPIVPSVEDEMAAKILMNETAAALSSSNELDALKNRKGFSTQRSTITIGLLDRMVKEGNGNPRLKAFADSAKVGEAAVISNGGTYGYQVAKLLNTEVAPDSITMAMIVLDPTVANTDSILTQLNSGVALETIRNIEGVQLALDSIATSIITPSFPDQIGQLIGSDLSTYKGSFENNAIGNFFVADTLNFHPEMTTIYAIKDRKAPVKNVELAIAQYNLEPSETTVNNLRDNLQKFITENNTADKFEANAAAANYMSMSSYITASTPFIYMTDAFGGYVNDPRNPREFMQVNNSNPLVTWALEADKGSVSKIYGNRNQGNFAVIAVNDIYDDFRPVTDPVVKQQLTERVRNTKKGDALVAQYNGAATDLAGYAKIMNVQIDSLDVNFGRDNLGAELLAGIATAEKGKLSAPAKGRIGVVVYQVEDVNAPQRAFDLKSDAAIFHQTRGAALLASPERLFKLLLGNAKFDNNLYKIYKNTENE